MPRLTRDKIAVIKNDFEEMGWNAHRIWIEHPSFNCSRIAVYKLVKKIEITGSAERCKGSGRPVTAPTEENCAEVEGLIWT